MIIGTPVRHRSGCPIEFPEEINRLIDERIAQGRENALRRWLGTASLPGRVALSSACCGLRARRGCESRLCPVRGN